MRRMVLLFLVVLPFAPCTAGADEGAAAPWLARLEHDPLDAEALLALADLYESQGETGYARRHLRAFLRLHLEHPRRVEAARRVAALRPKHPFLTEEDGRQDGGYLVYRNVLDGTLAVRVPEGPYLRILRPRHPVSEERMELRFQVDLPAYLADLHETRTSAWQSFVLESGFSVPAYWGDDAVAFLASTQDGRGVPWTWVGGQPASPSLPAWPLTFFEARALARANGKRLPTEAEWEKAARGGVELGSDPWHANPLPARRHPWGDAPAEGVAGAHRAMAGGFRGGDDASVAVDSMPQGASPYGCLHMLGNVQEWCADGYWDDDEVLQLPTRSPLASTVDPTGERVRSRVCKGGYFNWGLGSLSIDARTPHTYDSRGMALLFKCALRAFADPPPLDFDGDPVDDDPALSVPRPDPLDAERLYDGGMHALDEGEGERAWRHFRAAARLQPHGPLRALYLRHVAASRPVALWERTADGRWRNRVDGAVAVEVGELLVDVHEVTEGRYLTFLAETATNSDASLGVNESRLGNGDLPAATLTPAMADAYATWAGKRLPTRAEWMAIAHVGRTPFPWGDADVKERAAVEASFTEAHLERWDHRVPVGSFPTGASPEGVLDLVGNVAEWCADGADPWERWVVGGDADRWRDVGDAEDFRDTLDDSQPTETDLTRNAFVGARCVAPVPRPADR